MSDDIAADVQRLTSIVERLPQLGEYARVLKESHEGLKSEISDIAGLTSGFAQDVRGDVQFADKMIDDYVQWMGALTEKIADFRNRVQQAGGSF